MNKHVRAPTSTVVASAGYKELTESTTLTEYICVYMCRVISDDSDVRHTEERANMHHTTTIL